MIRSRRRTITVMLGLIGLATSAASAGVVNVPGDHPTIQEACIAAIDGDEIIIAPGTYTGPGNVGISLWDKRLTVRSSTRNPADVIIDCNLADRAFHIGSDGDHGSVIQGLHIVNGRSTSGGAILIGQVDVTIVDCHFTNNASTGAGGAIYVYDSASTLRRCRFRANSAALDGGGVIIQSSDEPTVVDACVFLGNTAQRGGGLYSIFASPVVANSVFSGNEATVKGGGMQRATDDAGLIVNCVVSENHAPISGGGMAVYTDATPVIINTIFWGNTDDDTSDAYDQIDPRLGAPIVMYSCIQDGWTGAGIHNMSTDPLLVDANGPDDDPGNLDDNCRLMSTSPCIDAGLSVALETDLDGNGRIADDPATPDSGTGFQTVIDLGPYEYGATPFCAADIDGNGTVDFSDLVSVLADWGVCP